jgi:glutaredoxin
MLRKIRSVLLFSLLGLFLIPLIVVPLGRTSAQNSQINIYFFWGEGCPHCASAKPVLREIAEGNSGITLYEYEVYQSEENLNLFYQIAEAHGTVPQAVPTTFIGERYWIGYSEDIRVEIEGYLSYCLTNGCTDLAAGIVDGEPVLPTPSPEMVTEAPTEVPPTPVSTPQVEENVKDENLITIPLFGTINLSNQSMLVSTLLISFVDGFNPCSIWVLSMLLAITLNTRSRKKVLIVGFVFIFVTGLIYALFIAGLFTVLRVVRFVGWVQVIVALVALAFALINIKDYFWYKEGVSLTIKDEKKPGIYKGMRRVVRAEDSIWTMIGATIILAAGVSLVEFSCTAGFPVLWTNLLNSQNVTGAAFLGLLLVYMFIYQIDELGIFLVSVFTLRKTRLEEKHGRLLKLLGGSLMLALALVMLIDPTIMNDVGTSLWVFAAAIGFAALVLLVHRVILPKFNVVIGSKK